jgi:DNA primase large subunit
MTHAEFMKRYAYDIRHSYGKAGKCHDYSPHTCNQVLRFKKPGNREYHGCPFKVSTTGETAERERERGRERGGERGRELFERQM